MEMPKNIIKILENENLCAMATSLDDQPYLSLMNFTYVEPENKIILSSRKNSKKYNNIQKNKNISLLVSSNSPKKSVTFLGTALTLSPGDNNEEYYRKLHAKNCDMPQFILGDNIGLIIFSIEKIIISDNQDQVEYIN